MNTKIFKRNRSLLWEAAASSLKVDADSGRASGILWWSVYFVSSRPRRSLLFRIFFKFVKILLIIVAAFFSAVVILIFCGTYFFLSSGETITAPLDRRINAGLDFIDEIVAVGNDPRLGAASPLCDILCKPSTWSHLSAEKIEDRFRSFQKTEGARAFEDPEFRLAYETLNVYADVIQIVGHSMKEIGLLRQTDRELSNSEKILISAKAPLTISRLAAKIYYQFPISERRSEVVTEIQNLNEQCGKRSRAAIREACLKLPSF